METGLTKAQVISEIGRSPHKELKEYLPICTQAVQEDPEFFAHLIVWNHIKGEIRDAKAALPVIQLAGVNRDQERYYVQGYVENALAHLADLNPKLLVRALTFGKAIGIPKNLTYRFVTRYLRDLEADPRDWENTALQHQASLTTLYARYHVSRGDMVERGFNWRNQETKMRPALRLRKFEVVRQLAIRTPIEIVAAVDKHKLPWLIVRGALGARAKEPDVLMALMGRMTAADLATSAKWLIKAGVKDHPQTRAAFEALIEKAGKPTRQRGSALKVGKAAKVLQADGDEKTAGKLNALQERQLTQLKTVEGNWLIIGDKSGSMQHSILLAKRVAGVLAHSVKGCVYLVFADTDPRPVGDVSGKSLEAIELTTAAVQAQGATSLGCALSYARVQKWDLDGIVVVSDGAENTYPLLAAEYVVYTKKTGKSPTVYWYRTQHDNDSHTPEWIRAFQLNMDRAGAGMTTFDLRTGIDDYSIPNLVQTMRVGKYSLLDEILGTKLRTLDEVLSRTVGMGVIRRRVQRASA